MDGFSDAEQIWHRSEGYVLGEELCNIGSGLLTLKSRLFRRRAGLVLVPFLAVLVVLLTGFVPVDQSRFGMVFQYGMPLSWKARWPMQYPGYIDPSVGVFVYSWDVFVADTLLYAGLGYLLILWSKRRSSLFRDTLILVSSGWVACATALFAWSSQNGSLTNGLPVPWTGLGVFVWFYNLTLLAADVVFVAGFEYLAFFLYRGIRWSKPSAGPMPVVNDPDALTT